MLREILSKHSLSEKVLKAYRACPHHLFINSFSVDTEKWIHLTSENLKEFLPLIYSDTTLLLFERDDQICTISQPSLVLLMLEMLNIKAGDKIIELGAGSGWNAAMLGYLTGPDGLVVSIEIIREMALLANDKVHALNQNQVHIIFGDGTLGFKEEAPYDLGVFTAGAYDIPNVFYDQIKDDGKLLFILKLRTFDLLLLLKKQGDCFEEITRLNVRFVPVTGERPRYSEDLQEVANSSKIYFYRKDHLPLPNSSLKILTGDTSKLVIQK